MPSNVEEKTSLTVKDEEECNNHSDNNIAFETDGSDDRTKNILSIIPIQNTSLTNPRRKGRGNSNMAVSKRKLDSISNSSSTDTKDDSVSISITDSTSGNYSKRISQACDRCRSKKTRCDGKRPQCSQCAIVGFECKVSDKLQRKSYPRGYTETLEEKIRELQTENKRLLAIYNLKQNQLSVSSSSSSTSPNKKGNGNDCAVQSNSTSTSAINDTNENGSNETAMKEIIQSQLIPLTNINSVHDPIQNNDDNTHTDCCNHTIKTINPDNNNNYSTHTTNGKLHRDTNDHHLHPKPVSTNSNGLNSISFEQNEAPGLSTVKALKSMVNDEKNTQLATLVSLAIPRSTEEILFIPQILAKVRQNFGFTSKHCLYTVSLLSSLKSFLSNSNNSISAASADNKNLETLKNTNLWKFNALFQFFTAFLKLDFLDSSLEKQNKGKKNGKVNNNNNNSANQDGISPLSSSEIDELLKLFFQNWSDFVLMINEKEFYQYYSVFKSDLQNNNISKMSLSTLMNYKIFGLIILLFCQMGLLSKIKLSSNNTKSKNFKQQYHLKKVMNYYHNLINKLMWNEFFKISNVTLQSLKLLSLILFYNLHMGNISNIYELRSKVISMSQQLRLHRCPSAVLCGSTLKIHKLEQSNRRLLFWNIYYLDIFASLQLGVPRLLKDHEIECALPIPMDTDSKSDNQSQRSAATNAENDDNKIKLEGCVSHLSLVIIRYSQIVGNILDMIFKRNMTESMTKSIALIHIHALDDWRNTLPSNLKFDLNVNGSIDLSSFIDQQNLNEEEQRTQQQKLLVIFLYFFGVNMIHMPVVASRPLPLVENDSLNQIPDRSSSSYIALQHATNTMLNVLDLLSPTYVPLPINMSRTMVRFSMISACGMLDFIKGGSLFLENKALLAQVVKNIETDRFLDLPGVISWHSLKLFDLTLTLFFQNTNIKLEKLDKLLEKKSNYYNRLMGKPIVRNPAEKNSTTVPASMSAVDETDLPRADKKKKDIVDTENEYVSSVPDTNNIVVKQTPEEWDTSTKTNVKDSTLAHKLTTIELPSTDKKKRKQEQISPVNKKAKKAEQEVSQTQVGVPRSSTSSTAQNSNYANIQNQFADALQFDPILNSNSFNFSNLDLSSLFKTVDKDSQKTNNLQVPTQNSDQPVAANGISTTVPTTSIQSFPTPKSLIQNDQILLSKIPSFNDFFKDYSYDRTSSLLGLSGLNNNNNNNTNINNINNSTSNEIQKQNSSDTGNPSRNTQAQMNDFNGKYQLLSSPSQLLPKQATNTVFLNKDKANKNDIGSLSTMMMLINNEIPFSSVNLSELLKPSESKTSNDNASNGISANSHNSLEFGNTLKLNQNGNSNVTTNGTSMNQVEIPSTLIADSLTDTPIPDYNYFVDASLGLAPLLETQRRHNSFPETSQPLVNTSNAMNLGNASLSSTANNNNTMPSIANNVGYNNPPLLSSSKQKPRHLPTNDTGDILNFNGDLSNLNFRRDVRRKRENLEDLFSWQNSR
ncbi:DNA-binding transcription factor CAT8 NDAI_0K00390 [Naumovozyma dairenensis CBS 421]|uniref:Zn(2)-C6 fungal-type domain-containing protein n=1 Tax=Naumovozyma dairenensis (strain ATCC 10597 / BCRC 20456 / CBS 421 / NBRC 0211 / NRRL Y-12639) TaxID=1071378 RepID=G0WHG9_NAUDC|nr:hypothetical protein NDAI_0K00390 [Naumovozyma dairenensis CBS 421]CCD27230.1 hypothetical protein NDAI_0K00390 [Naumovozyma dairenensis CBS 421]